MPYSIFTFLLSRQGLALKYSATNTSQSNCNYNCSICAATGIEPRSISLRSSYHTTLLSGSIADVVLVCVEGEQGVEIFGAVVMRVVLDVLVLAV